MAKRKWLNDPRDWSGCTTIDTKSYKALLPHSRGVGACPRPGPP
jgi:hypothetical protein